MKVVKLVLLLMLCSGPSVLLGMEEQKKPVFRKTPTMLQGQAHLQQTKDRIKVFRDHIKQRIDEDNAVVIGHCDNCDATCVHCAAKDDATTPFKGSAKLFSVLGKECDVIADDTWTTVECDGTLVEKPAKCDVASPDQKKPEQDGDPDSWLFVPDKKNPEGEPAEQEIKDLVELEQALKALGIADLTEMIIDVDYKDAKQADEDLAVVIDPLMRELKKFLAEQFDASKDMPSDDRARTKQLLQELLNDEKSLEALATAVIAQEILDQDRCAQNYESTPLKIARAVLPSSRDLALASAALKTGYDVAKPWVRAWYKGLSPFKAVVLVANFGISYLPPFKPIQLGMLGLNTVQNLISIYCTDDDKA